MALAPSPLDFRATKIAADMPQPRTSAIALLHDQASSIRSGEEALDTSPEAWLTKMPRLDQLPLGELRLYSLHNEESISVRVFENRGSVRSEGMEQLRKLMRCRITGAEANIDKHLARILTMVSMIYGKTLHLVSGHRTPHTIGTSTTSQHAFGRAADIRVPGVSIDELAAVVTALGARGVGLYRHKNFLHVDVRSKRRWYWEDNEHDEEGDEADVQAIEVAQENLDDGELSTKHPTYDARSVSSDSQTDGRPQPFPG